MGNMGYRYKRVGRRSWHGGRGFRLNPKRFSVLIRVRVRLLMPLFRLCHQALQSLKRIITTNRSRRGRRRSSSRTSLVMDGGGECRSFGRSNSFYAEAIADCLEFIKRSSISVDDISQAAQPQQHRLELDR